VFLLRRPTGRDIERFLERSQDLPLSYAPTGIVRNRPAVRFDEQAVVVGRGEVDFERAALPWLGLPVVRRLQARFRHDSAAAMRRAISARA